MGVLCAQYALHSVVLCSSDSFDSDRSTSQQTCQANLSKLTINTTCPSQRRSATRTHAPRANSRLVCHSR
eukprot:6020439-Pyramimonas_sp.AAC.1